MSKLASIINFDRILGVENTPQPRVPFKDNKALLDPLQTTSHQELVSELQNKGFEIQALRFDDCGKSFMHFMCGCKIIKVAKGCNYYKVCESCGNKRFKKLRRRFLPIIVKYPLFRNANGGMSLKFLTLSIKNIASLSEGMSKLRKSFNKFIRRQYVIDRVKGGLGAVEAVIDENGFWHVHLHLLVLASYVDMQSHKSTGGLSKFAEEWFFVTGDSYIVDIKKCTTYSGALNYCLKYMTKPPAGLSAKQLAEYFTITFKRRLLFTFGCFYRAGDDVKVPCLDCGSFFSYVSDFEYFQIYGKNWWDQDPDPPPNHSVLNYYLENQINNKFMEVM